MEAEEQQKTGKAWELVLFHLTKTRTPFIKGEVIKLERNTYHVNNIRWTQGGHKGEGSAFK